MKTHGEIETVMYDGMALNRNKARGAVSIHYPMTTCESYINNDPVATFDGSMDAKKRVVRSDSQESRLFGHRINTCKRQTPEIVLEQYEAD